MNQRTHTFDKTISKQNLGPLMVSNADRQRIYEKAVKHQMYPMGEEYRDTNGLYADWAPFDFILSMITFPPNTSVMRILKGFWAENWKYLGRVVKCYEAVSQDYIKAMEEMDLVVKDHAKQNLELQICQKWIKDCGAGKQFAEFRAVMVEEHEKAVAKVIADDKERQEKLEEAKKAKGKEL